MSISCIWIQAEVLALLGLEPPGIGTGAAPAALLEVLEFKISNQSCEDPGTVRFYNHGSQFLK